MVKSSIVFLFFLAFSVSVLAIPFKQVFQGQKDYSYWTRSLEVSKNSTQSEIQVIPFKIYHSNYSCSISVGVNLGQAYATANNISVNSSTDMLIVLHSNTTSFCGNCDSFVDYQCKTDACAADWKNLTSVVSPFVNITQGVPVKHSISIGNGTDVWKLNTSAIYFTKENSTLQYSGQNKTLYGFLGLGVEGEARNNFKNQNGTLFSIKIDIDHEKGQLIFGNDTTQYNNIDKPIIFPTNRNWGVQTTGLSFGASIKKSFNSTLVFDLQKEGISFPFKYFSADKLWFESFRNQHNFSMDAFQTYPYFFNGDISSLPPLQFNLSSGVSLTLPACAYAKQIGKNQYQILINGLENENHENIVFGWYAMGHYYSVFHLNQAGSPHVSMYPIIFAKEQEPSSGRSDYTLLYLAFIGTILVGIASAIAHCLKRAKRKGPGEAGLELKGNLHGLRNIKPVQFDD